MATYSATIVSDVMSDTITVDDDMTFRWAAIRSSGVFSTITNTALLNVKFGSGIIASGLNTTVLNTGGVIAHGSCLYAPRRPHQHPFIFRTG